MALEQRDKELAAIGASIGANCRPCIEHHLAAAWEAGLSEAELDDAVTTAHAVRREAADLLPGGSTSSLGMVVPRRSRLGLLRRRRPGELAALGVSVGANPDTLLHVHIGAALDVGLGLSQIRSALTMAGYVQQHAAASTADAVTRAPPERAAAPADAVIAHS